MGKKIIQDLTKAGKPKSEIKPIGEQLETYRKFVEPDKNKWLQYREKLKEIFYSDDSWSRFVSKVESCGLDQVKLERVFSTIFEEIWSATDKLNFIHSIRLCYYFRELDGLMYGYLQALRSLEILLPLMESFIGILEKRDIEQSAVSQTLEENEVFVAVWIYSTWMTFCRQETDLDSTDLSTRFSQVRILTAIKKIPTGRIPDLLKCFNDWDQLRTRHKFDVFIKIHSESTEKEIRALVPFCRSIQNKLNGHCN